MKVTVVYRTYRKPGRYSDILTVEECGSNFVLYGTEGKRAVLSRMDIAEILIESQVLPMIREATDGL